MKRREFITLLGAQRLLGRSRHTRRHIRRVPSHWSWRTRQAAVWMRWAE